MIYKKTILIICRDPSEISMISQLKHESDYRYIIASDDIMVQKIVSQYSWVDKVCWIERMDSLYKVSSDVITILDAVNRWLESLADDQKGISTDLLFWIRHAEGGMTTQRIQDLLLLIMSYQYLLNNYNVNKIILFRFHHIRWEDDVLIHTAQSMGIDVQEIKSLKYQIKLLVKRSFPYMIYKAIREEKLWQIKRTIPVSSKTKNESEIVFLLWCLGDRFIENMVPLMESFQKRGFKSVALTWRATRSAEKIRQKGLYAEELETYLPSSSSWQALRRTFYTLTKATKKIKQFFALSQLQYQGVPLGPLLWPSVKYFFYIELPIRYKLKQAIMKYFMNHNVVAFAPLGGETFYPGRIALRNLNRKKRPLVFLNWIGISMPQWPYSTKQTSIDLFLAAGQIQKRIAQERDGFSPTQVAMVGDWQYRHLRHWKKIYSIDKSRSLLSIPLTYNFYIFYDFGRPLRGVLTTREQVLVINALLDFTKEHPSVALLIKPHPSHGSVRLEQLKQVTQYYRLPNVFVIDKNILPCHALNSANIIITKHSTIGIEGMLLNKPIISVYLDGEKRWKSLFEEAAEYVETVGALRELLEKLIDDTKFFSQWIKEHIKRQKHFLKQYYIKQSQPPVLSATNAIISCLEKLGFCFKDSNK